MVVSYSCIDRRSGEKCITQLPQSERRVNKKLFRLVCFWFGDRSRIRPLSGTGALVDLRGDCPATCGIEKRAAAAGHDVSSRRSGYTFVLRSFKSPTDRKEHAVLSVRSDDDRSAAKGSLIILDACQRPSEVTKMRSRARCVEVDLGQPARQFRHACDGCRAGSGEWHLLVLSDRGAGGADNEKQRET